jgi:hypothetical protein
MQQAPVSSIDQGGGKSQIGHPSNRRSSFGAAEANSQADQRNDQQTNDD